jgi:DNA (cytosine-5)-methyltransferase 1
MPAYYNEIDPYAAAWLRRLIAGGHIADGIVDERSIEDIHPAELREFTQCHFFAGIGVWSRALRLAHWPDERRVWTGSCPCQPFSAAGKGAGFADERHLWPAFHHLIAECRPPVVFGEQVASKDGLQWLDLVRADLEGSGYACGAADLCAAGIGAPHIRQRLWWVGYPIVAGLEGFTWDGNDGNKPGRLDPIPDGPVAAAGRTGGFWAHAGWLRCRDGLERPVESGTFPLAHGASARVGRLRAYGNAIVPQVAEVFIRAVLGE